MRICPNTIRQLYRDRFLDNLFSDGAERLEGNGEWWESVGMAYSRRLWRHQIATTRAPSNSSSSTR
jgi:hypothetical protein